MNYSDPTGHKKGFFSNLWNGAKKAVKKVVTKVKSAARGVKNFVNNAIKTVKTVANNLWNGAKQVASNIYNGAKNLYNRANNYLSGGSSGGNSGRMVYGPPDKYVNGGWATNSSPNSYGYVSYQQQVANQTAQRQQRLNLEYQQVTGSKGEPKTKEGANLLRN